MDDIMKFDSEMAWLVAYMRFSLFIVILNCSYVFRCDIIVVVIIIIIRLSYVMKVSLNSLTISQPVFYTSLHVCVP